MAAIFYHSVNITLDIASFSALHSVDIIMKNEGNFVKARKEIRSLKSPK